MAQNWVGLYLQLSLRPRLIFRNSNANLVGVVDVRTGILWTLPVIHHGHLPLKNAAKGV